MGNLSYLIPVLRLELGDINPASYRFTDDWLDIALKAGVKALQRWWGMRYIEDGGDIIRNPDYDFSSAASPLIQTQDETPLILMTAVILKEGSLESSAWSTWRDAEYYVSNVENGKIKEASTKRAMDRLLAYLKPPQKRLNSGSRETFDFGADETT